jgi:hypothetical protein
MGVNSELIGYFFSQRREGNATKSSRTKPTENTKLIIDLPLMLLYVAITEDAFNSPFNIKSYFFFNPPF